MECKATAVTSLLDLTIRAVWFTLLVSYIYRVVLFYLYKLFKQVWCFLPVCIYFCSDKTGAIWIL